MACPTVLSGASVHHDKMKRIKHASAAAMAKLRALTTRPCPVCVRRRAMRALQPHDVQVLESTDGVRAVVRVTLRAPAYLPRPLRGKLVRLIVKYIPEDREAANMV
jgi:hypothetical protein